MKLYLYAAGALAALAVAHPASASTNLIKNGGFDIPGNIVGDYAVLSDQNTPLNFAWGINGTVDVFRTDGALGGEPDPVGGDPFALDLVGSGDTGGIYQFINTEIGKTYRLVFDYANNPFIAGAAMNFGVSGFGGISFLEELGHSGSTTGAMNWQTYTIDFVAKSGTSTVFFNNTAGSRAAGMYLDNIRIFDPTEVAGVPEPTAWALMIGGFGMAGMALRQRRRVGPVAA